MTAFPDVTVHEISDDDEFLVIACDGALFTHKFTSYSHNTSSLPSTSPLPLLTSLSHFTSSLHVVKKPTFTIYIYTP